MIKLLDYILDLFRDEGQAQAFVANPDQALADAGLSTVSSAQLQSVAATVSPSLAMGGSGEPVTDLKQAVSSYYGFQPQPDLAPQADFFPGTDLASNNSFMSPTTNITDDHSLSFGMGDITLGDKTTAHGDGAFAVGGSTHGDIVSGDGAVLGDGNTVNNGDIHSAAGSTVTVGDGNVISEGTRLRVATCSARTTGPSSRHRATAPRRCRTATPPTCTELRPSPISTARTTPVPSTTVPRSPTRRRSITLNTIRRCTRPLSWTPPYTTVQSTTARSRTRRCTTTRSTRQRTPIPAWTPTSGSDTSRLRRWWFVVRGKPGSALSFFFGDEFGSLASFLVDGVAAVLLAGCLRRGIIRPRSVSRQTVCGGMSSSPVSRSSAENMLVPWGS